MEIRGPEGFEQRVRQHLQQDQVAWLTTVGADGTPHPRPVWFLAEGDRVLVFSQPGTAKLRHLARNPRVSLSFNCTPDGGDVVAMTGTATVDDSKPKAEAPDAYLTKYAEGIKQIGHTVDSMRETYRVAIDITLEKATGH